MNSDLSGLPKGSLPPQIPPSSPSLTGDITTEQATAVDFLVYEGTDTIGTANVLGSQQLYAKIFYEAPAQVPILLQPDPDGQTGPQPYSIAEQRLVKKDFAKHIRELIAKAGLDPDKSKELYQALMSGKTPSDPSLAALAKNIGDQAAQLTRKESHLPDSWTPQSTSTQDWIPIPLVPYDAQKQAEINAQYDQNVQAAFNTFIAQASPPLTADQITLLKTAISTGKVSSQIVDAFNAITKSAATATQKTYGLSETWYKETPSLDDWKPINLGVVTPEAVNKERGQLLLSNVETILNNLDKIGDKIRADLPPNDPNNVTMSDFKAVITTAILALKDELRRIQLADAEKSKSTEQLKMDAVDARQKRLEESIEKQKEAERKQKKAEKVSLVMKIVGPIVAAVATIVGAALAIFTFGASTALIVAGIAVGAAMTAYAIVDSATGCTQKIVQAVNKWMAESFPDNPTMQKLMKALLTTAVVAVLVAVIVASVFTGGSGASFAVQVIKEVAKQMAIQALIMTIMASNSIPEVFGVILKAAGVNEKDSQIAEIIMMIVTMITVMLAMAAGGKIGETIKDAASGIQQLPGKLLSTLKNIGGTIKQAMTAEEASLEQGLTVAINKLKELIKEYLEMLAALPGNIGQAARQTKDGFLEIGLSFRRVVKYLTEKPPTQRAREKLEDFNKRLDEFNKAKREAMNEGMRGTQKVLQLTNHGINVADGFTRGVMGMQVSKLLKEVGSYKEAEEVLQAIIQLLDKLLQSIQSGIDARAQDMITLQQAYTHFLNSIQQASSKINAPIQG